MMPKNSSAIDFDLSSKGLSWVDFVCQKFEVMCVEVDKNPSLLIQETTKFVENQMSAVGTNVQKFCADLFEDIIPSNPEVAIKCLSSSMSDEIGDDIELSERLEPETKSNQTAHSESVVSPLCFQESQFEVLPPNIMKKVSTSSLQEENVSMESTQKDMSEKKPVAHHFDKDVHRDIPEVTWLLHETTYVGEHPERVMRQEKVLVQLDSLLLSNRTGAVDRADQRSNVGMGPIGGMRVRDSPNSGDETVSRMGAMEVNMENTVEQNHAHADSSGDTANSNIGVLANLEKSEAGRQNHAEKEYGETALSIFESFIEDPPSCSKEECFDESMVIPDAENEQEAFWYENKDAQRQHGIDISSRFDIMDVDKRHNSEISDSEWELL